MSTIPPEKELEQLKIDYLTYMEQIHKTLGYDVQRHGILLTLILESRHVTQDEVEELTGYGKSIVSENLTQLTSIMSKYPVYETRKKGEKKKFYYTHLTFTKYAKINFLGSLESMQLNMDFLPKMIVRLQGIEMSEDVEYTKSTFEFLLKLSRFLQVFALHAEKHIDELFEKKSGNEFRISDIEVPDTNIYGTLEELEVKRKYDSIFEIKKEFILKMQEYGSDVGRRKELVSILTALFLSNEPLNQDELIELTGHSRSIISEGLKLLVKTQSIVVVKKPNDRKKYYRTRTKLQEFGLQGYETRRKLYTRVRKTIEETFKEKLNALPVEDSEKSILNDFFTENIKSYQVLEDYLSDFYKYFYEKGHLQEYG